MGVSTSQILDVLAYYGIEPLGDDDRFDDPDVRVTGEIGDNEQIYPVTLDDILLENLDLRAGMDVMGTRPHESSESRFYDKLSEIIEDDGWPRPKWTTMPPPEADCAWYCPIHYFGHGWGIYIRETCVIERALHIANFVDRRMTGGMSKREIGHSLMRSAFYELFLHEQFHHKVESLGFRLLVSSGTDRYRPYQRRVYGKTYLTSECLEESLANAEILRRVNEPRYTKSLALPFREALKEFLRLTIPLEPPGYREGLNFVSEQNYRNGLWELQSQVHTTTCPASFPTAHWAIAPNAIRSLMDIDKQIYVIVPAGERPILSWSNIKPAPTTNSRKLINALIRYYRYRRVPGAGKGSHVKLERDGGPTLTIPDNRKNVSPGVLKETLRSLGNFNLVQLPELLDGRLPS